MEKSIQSYILAGLALFFLVACSSSDSPAPPEPPVEVTPPSAATLVFPEENSECTEGANLTSTESTILFNWNDAENADSYQIFVKNLETQSTTNYTSNISEKSITILRGTSYSWYVVSKNTSSTTANSSIWKFYNAGEAVSSHAPFPADIISPVYDKTFDISTTNVTLEWSGDDIDDDIKEYTVLFGTSTVPQTEQNTITTNTLSVRVESGNSYYWRIITKDKENNSSESPIFKFNIK